VSVSAFVPGHFHGLFGAVQVVKEGTVMGLKAEKLES